MVKRRANGSTAHARGQPRLQRRPGIVQSSIYLPVPMHDALREAAFKEHRKIHDIMLEGIQLALDKRRERSR